MRFARTLMISAALFSVCAHADGLKCRVEMKSVGEERTPYGAPGGIIARLYEVYKAKADTKAGASIAPSSNLSGQELYEQALAEAQAGVPVKPGATVERLLEMGSRYDSHFGFDYDGIKFIRAYTHVQNKLEQISFIDFSKASFEAIDKFYRSLRNIDLGSESSMRKNFPSKPVAFQNRSSHLNQSQSQEFLSDFERSQPEWEHRVEFLNTYIYKILEKRALLFTAHDAKIIMDAYDAVRQSGQLPQTIQSAPLLPQVERDFSGIQTYFEGAPPPEYQMMNGEKVVFTDTPLPHSYYVVDLSGAKSLEAFDAFVSVLTTRVQQLLKSNQLQVQPRGVFARVFRRRGQMVSSEDSTLPLTRLIRRMVAYGRPQMVEKFVPPLAFIDMIAGNIVRQEKATSDGKEKENASRREKSEDINRIKTLNTLRVEETVDALQTVIEDTQLTEQRKRERRNAAIAQNRAALVQRRAENDEKLAKKVEERRKLLGEVYGNAAVTPKIIPYRRSNFDKDKPEVQWTGFSGMNSQPTAYVPLAPLPLFKPPKATMTGPKTNSNTKSSDTIPADSVPGTAN